MLLGQGRLLFDNLDPEQIELERTRTVEGDNVTHLRYRVKSTRAEIERPRVSGAFP